MKISFPFFILLFSALPTFAAEAWWLEMDTIFHEALMKRFSEGDPVACLQVTDKLPDLVKSGRIKELEWIDSESKTGGRNVPAAAVNYKIPGDSRDLKLQTGSDFKWHQDTGKFWFKIRTAGNGMGAEIVIGAFANLGTQWQPTFSIETAGRARVLFVRDPGASEAFKKAKALFTLKASMTEFSTLTWVLGEKHPGLVPPSEKQSHKIEFGSFNEFTNGFLGSPVSLRGFGALYDWSFDPRNGSSFRTKAAKEGKGKSNIATGFDAKGKLGSPGSSTKAPVNSYTEKVDSSGMHSFEDKKVSGEAVATLTLLP